MRYVFKLMVLAAFVAGTTLAVGCGETASTDTEPKADTESSTSMTAPESIDGSVSQVSFEVTGMTWPTGWGSKIKKALAELPGVTVDEVTKDSVTVSGDVDSDKVIAAIEGAGFGASVAGSN